MRFVTHIGIQNDANPDVILYFVSRKICIPQILKSPVIPRIIV